MSGRFCPVTAPEHGVQQNKSPLVSRPWPGPTKGLRDAPAPSMGTGELMVDTSPEWLWKQHSTQGVLVKRDNKELLWLFHRVFHQRKPARLNERMSPFAAPAGASGITERVPASQRNLAAGEGDHETSAQPLDNRQRVCPGKGGIFWCCHTCFMSCWGGTG